MDVIHSVAELRARLKRETAVALVPTMGNLHAGHLSLVTLAHDHGSCIVATIFVNRLQFEPGGDFDRYPRTIEHDLAMLEEAGCNVVFAPGEKEMYPGPQEIRVTPPKVAEQLDGTHRPGHFEGVTTVVSKLFNIVAPHAAVFGKKDYQQLHVIRAMVKQLNFGIEIVAGETVREPDGLAMSSRNNYLSADERKEAVMLSQELAKVKQAIESGSHRQHRHEEMAMAALATAGWKVDYVALRNQAALAPPGAHDTELVVLGAAWLGKTRLIDNMEIRAKA
ncbi:MAG TPA: pantoate--beta-alanine ligase [Usitatibacter sp.]|nr:pantoate--beta-alanine ligase [Usitatibacter sp.]